MEMKNDINLNGKHLHKQLPLSLPALEEKILVNILSPPLNELSLFYLWNEVEGLNFFYYRRRRAVGGNKNIDKLLIALDSMLALVLSSLVTRKSPKFMSSNKKFSSFSDLFCKVQKWKCGKSQ